MFHVATNLMMKNDLDEEPNFTLNVMDLPSLLVEPPLTSGFDKWLPPCTLDSLTCRGRKYYFHGYGLFVASALQKLDKVPI